MKSACNTGQRNTWFDNTQIVKCHWSSDLASYPWGQAVKWFVTLREQDISHCIRISNNSSWQGSSISSLVSSQWWSTFFHPFNNHYLF